MQEPSQKRRTSPQDPPRSTRPTTAEVISGDVDNVDSAAGGLWGWKQNPYARLARWDKPIGTWLLFWPCAWSTALAATNGGLPDIVLVAQFGVGAFLMRGAGCTINDLWDSNIDRQVERTKTRPLASGELSHGQALAFLALQLSGGLGVLLSLPHVAYCVQWGVASLPLVVLYPATKRFFAAPQLVLGLTFNWGAFMGYSAVHGTMDWALILPLYGSGVTWTLLYDTIYAHQDKAYDRQLGLQSTALTFGTSDDTQKRILYGLATLTYGQWLCAVGCAADVVTQTQSLAWWACSAGGLTGAYTHLLWQVKTADLHDPQSCLERFQSNAVVGTIVFGSLAASRYLATTAATAVV